MRSCSASAKNRADALRQSKTRRLLLILGNCERLQACATCKRDPARRGVQIRKPRVAARVSEQTFYVPLPVLKGGRWKGCCNRQPCSCSLTRTAAQAVVRGGRARGAGWRRTRRAPRGILALELAAARLRSLTLGEINARLQDRYKVLTGGGRTLLARQQTLLALVDWSYDLLSEHEQVLLQRLSSFAGGCDLRAVEEVCGVEPLAPEDIVDLLDSLVDKSLVLPEQGGEGTRYRMLETVRDYARLKLTESGDMEGASSRHCNYYFAMVKDGSRGTRGPEQPKWVARLEADHDNVRAAIAYSMGSRGDPVIAVKIEVAMGFACIVCERRPQQLARAAGASGDHVHDLARGWALYVAA